MNKNNTYISTSDSQDIDFEDLVQTRRYSLLMHTAYDFTEHILHFIEKTDMPAESKERIKRKIDAQLDIEISQMTDIINGKHDGFFGRKTLPRA